jgi:formate hydrogenlyase subunit 3/multisubunit Na+/H+ antiporter MnhD subunit
MISDPVIILMLLPFVGGLACLLLPRRYGQEAGGVAVAASVLSLLLAFRVFLLNRCAGGCLLTDAGSALAPTGFCLDNLSAFVVLATALFALLIAIYSLDYMRQMSRLTEYYAYLLMTLSFSFGAILADHAILLLVFWGMLGITLYLMIGIAGTGAATAAKKTLIIIGGSDCFLMLGILILWTLTGSVYLSSGTVELGTPLSYIAFLCFAVAALAKAGAMPVHTWVPDCGEAAPVAVTAYLPASLDKLLGIYLLARTARGIFAMNTWTNGLLLLIGAGTVLFAVMMALVQHDLKRLLSYHAVSQVGYMVLGIGAGTALGLAGALFHMLNNAIYKSCLFLCAGSVEKRTCGCSAWPPRCSGQALLWPASSKSCMRRSSVNPALPWRGRRLSKSLPACGCRWLSWPPSAYSLASSRSPFRSAHSFTRPWGTLSLPAPGWLIPPPP